MNLVNWMSLTNILPSHISAKFFYFQLVVDLKYYVRIDMVLWKFFQAMKKKPNLPNLAAVMVLCLVFSRDGQIRNWFAY